MKVVRCLWQCGCSPLIFVSPSACSVNPVMSALHFRLHFLLILCCYSETCGYLPLPDPALMPSSMQTIDMRGVELDAKTIAKRLILNSKQGRVSNNNAVSVFDRHHHTSLENEFSQEHILPQVRSKLSQEVTCSNCSAKATMSASSTVSTAVHK